MAKNPKPTKQQIADQIKRLTEMKPKVRVSSMFGDNHHHAIDAQIKVLNDDLDEGGIQDRMDSGYWATNVGDAAMEARRWLDGEELMDEGPTPADGWRGLLR